MKTYTIKPLAWNRNVSARVESYRASGFYVERVNYAGEWGLWEYWTHGSSFSGECDSAEHGKQLCQQEHERRMMDFLEPVDKPTP